MAVPRGQTSPGNLKERIAALQQRSVSPNTHPSAQTLRGLPSPGTGGLRDKIAKFESKGGVPVPRGSFGMGAPPLTDNTPPKKRGELYGNRVPSLGRPTGTPLGSRSGSPLPQGSGMDIVDASPGPRKRCISTGAALSSSSSSSSVNFVASDEPVPPLPNGLSASAPRRNSLAVNFGSGRRVMSTNDVEGKSMPEFVDAIPPTSPSCVPETPPAETADSQPPIPEEIVIETGPLGEEEPQSSSLEATTPSESPPTVEQPLIADSTPDSPEINVDNPVEGLPVPQDQSAPAFDVSQDVSPPLAVKQSNGNTHSDDDTSFQSVTAQPSPRAIPSGASDTLSPCTTPHPPEADIIDPSTPPPEAETEPDAASPAWSITISAPAPTAPVPPSPQMRNPTAESPPQTKSTFKAIVHRKVTEAPFAPTAFALSPPAARQPADQRRSVSGNAVEVPHSPGCGDLAVLLEDAALLELRLTEGDGTGSKTKDSLATTPTTPNFQQDPRRASATTLTEYTPMPSVDSGSQSVRSMFIPSIREPLVDGEIPEGDETDGRSLASTTFSQRSPSHRKYLSNIYRLTGRRSSSYMPGAYPRDSMSMSSEDSSPVTTPSSDNGKRKGFGIAWPSASPKKDGSMSRSSSFADKIFNRNRTKSNVSTAADPVMSERTSLYEPSQPSLSLSFPSELSSEQHPDGIDVSNVGARRTSWISPGDSNSEFSPASSLLDKDIFDAFPSVPQTLPPGFRLDAENAAVGRASTLPVNGRKQVNQRLSMM